MFADVNGVLLVDKPAGISSAGVVRYLKTRLKPKKIGHGGTLDPFATGLLVILIGRGTKLSPLFLEGDKVYSGIIRLGLGTATDDITGEVTETDDEIAARVTPAMQSAIAADLMRRFSGEYEQTPPQFSALKIDGERSYRLARKGVEVAPKPRPVRVSELELRFIEPARLEYRLRCSKGFYVRSLARDIGRALSSAACVETLRREETSGFRVADALPMEDIPGREPGGLVLLPDAILERIGAARASSAGQTAGFV